MLYLFRQIVNILRTHLDACLIETLLKDMANIIFNVAQPDFVADLLRNVLNGLGAFADLSAGARPGVGLGARVSFVVKIISTGSCGIGHTQSSSRIAVPVNIPWSTVRRPAEASVYGEDPVMQL